MNRELLAEGQSRRYRRLALLPTFHPNLAFFRLHMVGVEGVDLHGTSIAPCETSLVGDVYKVEGVQIPKVPSHHPTILQPTQTPRRRARKAMDVQPSADRVCDGGSDFQQFVGNPCLLVDVMDICQVAAKGASLLSYLSHTCNT